MNIDIRKHIKDNFKDSTKDEIKVSIEESIKEQDEVTLPGIGVFFEILWQNSDENSKDYILNILDKALNSQNYKKKVDKINLLD